jgi:translation initiation factor IF-3
MISVIDAAGNNAGMFDRKTALDMANSEGMDLVLVSKNSKRPVAKIMDYGKYKYKKQKKEKSNKQKSKENSLKQIRLSPVIDVGDFDTKVKQARSFIEKGNSVRLNVRFKGRQLAHKELGLEVLNNFVEALSDISKKDSKISDSGKNISVTLAKDKDKIQSK